MSTGEKSDNDHQTRFRESELNLIRKMFENAPVSMCVSEGPEHRLRYMNKSFRRLYGNHTYPAGTPARMILTKVKNEQEVRDQLAILDKVYKTGEPVIGDEFKSCIDRGTTGVLEGGYFNLICQPLKDTKGEVYGIFIAGYEVTELVEARRAAAEQEQRLKIALEGGRVGFWEVDVRNNVFDFTSDRFRIGQVLTNLLENAIKYSPDADRIIVSYSREAGRIVVSVTDFGIGVSKVDQQKIFQRFFKGQDSKRTTYPGFGIGLYICLQIIERHGGGI